MTLTVVKTELGEPGACVKIPSNCLHGSKKVTIRVGLLYSIMVSDHGIRQYIAKTVTRQYPNGYCDGAAALL